MKTYLLNIVSDLKNWSDSLDVKTVLCNKSWLVFNDDGQKEVFIFQKDGTIIVSVDGKVTNAKWQYIPVNKSLVISNPNGDSYMMIPAYYDNKVLALQQDGTKKYSVLVDKQFVERLQLETLSRVDQYINHHDEYVKQVAMKKDEEKKELERKREIWKKEIDAKLDEWMKSSEYLMLEKSIEKKRYIFYSVLLAVFLIINLLLIFLTHFDILSIIAPNFILFAIGLFLLYFFCDSIYTYNLVEVKTSEFKKEHPFNPKNYK